MVYFTDQFATQQENPLKTQNLNLQRRQRGLGGSDIAPLMGMSPYKTPVELWAEKVNCDGLESRSALHLRYGQHVEPFVAHEFERLSGLQTIEYPETIDHPEYDFMFAHVDRFVVKDRHATEFFDNRPVTDSLLECKTASAYAKDEWGQAGTDQVPSAYLLQCVWYMAVTGCVRSHLAVLIGNNDFRLYVIERDAVLEGLVIERAKQFWFEHVLAGVPPAPAKPDDARLLFPREQSELTLEASPDLLSYVKELQELNNQIKTCESRSDELKTKIMQAMGEAQSLCQGSKLLATWRTTKGAQRIDTALLKKDFPEIALQCTSTSPSTRRFTLKG